MGSSAPLARRVRTWTREETCACINAAKYVSLIGLNDMALIVAMLPRTGPKGDQIGAAIRSGRSASGRSV